MECKTLYSNERKMKIVWQAPKCWYMKCLPCVKARYVLAVMLSVGICIVAALRINLSVAIVQMTAKNPHRNQRYGVIREQDTLCYLTCSM